MATRTISDAGGNWDSTDSWVEGEVPTTGDDVVATGTSGNLTINVNTAVLGSFVMTNYTGTLTHNSSRTLYCSGNITFVAGMTYTPISTTSSVIRPTGGNGTITTAGKQLSSFYANPGSGNTTTLADNLSMTGHLTKSAGTLDATTNTTTVTIVGNTGSNQIVGDVTLYNLTVTGYAGTSAALQIINSVTVTNDFVVNGNSALNRVLVFSNTLGTQRTITAANVSVSNADFRDIKGAGEGDWDLSGATGGSGDCGGNTGITFTTADDWYWNGSGTRNFSDYTYWYTATNGGGSQMASTRAPLPQDTMYIDANSIDDTTTIDQDMARIGTIDTTGADAFALHMNNLSFEIYGSLLVSSNLTFLCGYTQTFIGRGGAYTLKNETSGKFASMVIATIGGSVTLLSDRIDNGTSGGRTFYIRYGTFDANGFDVYSGQIGSDYSNTRTVLMGSGTWTADKAGGNDSSWDFRTTTNLTFDAEESTIIWGGTGSTGTQIFEGGGLTYNNLTIYSSTGTVSEIRGSNTFNVLTINKPKTVKFTDGTTQTVSSFVATGDAVDGIVLQGTSTGGWTISDDEGTNQVYYCTISYSTAEGGATWNATDNCTDGGNNTGWNFGTVVEISSAESLTLTQNAPDMLVDVLAGNVALSLSIQTALSFVISPNVFPSPIYLNLTVHGTPTVLIDNQLYDPEVVAGCPQCGTLMYREGAYDIDVGLGKIVARGSGRNVDLGSDYYVRCKRCGFPCKVKRDHYSHYGTREGWGTVYTVQDATHYSGW